MSSLVAFDDAPKVRFLAGVHQRFTDTLLKLFAAGDYVEVERIESSAFDFNPGVLVVVGTPHLGNGCRIIPSNLFNRPIKSHVQSNPRIMNVEPYRREQGKGHAASRQLLRSIQITNKGWPVEIILAKQGAYLEGAQSVHGDGTPGDPVPPWGSHARCCLNRVWGIKTMVRPNEIC